MTVLNEDILKDLDLVREVISNEECSIVVVKYGKIWKKIKGEGVKPMLEVIEEMGEDIYESVIGEKILGKASALLCRCAKASGVYSPKGTKTAIALLIMGGIPCQIDQMIPFIQNENGNDICSYEKMLKDVESPDEAYKILKDKLMK